jgi:hypothetical protein
MKTTPLRCMRKWRYRSTFLDLGTNWRWMVSVMPRLLCPREKALVPLNRRVGWAPEPVWMMQREFLTLPGLEHQPIGRPACSQSLYQLRYPGLNVTYLALFIYNCQYVNFWKSTVVTTFQSASASKNNILLIVYLWVFYDCKNKQSLLKVLYKVKTNDLCGGHVCPYNKSNSYKNGDSLKL